MAAPLSSGSSNLRQRLQHHLSAGVAENRRRRRGPRSRHAPPSQLIAGPVPPSSLSFTGEQRGWGRRPREGRNSSSRGGGGFGGHLHRQLFSGEMLPGLVEEVAAIKSCSSAGGGLGREDKGENKMSGEEKQDEGSGGPRQPTCLV